MIRQSLNNVNNEGQSNKKCETRQNIKLAKHRDLVFSGNKDTDRIIYILGAGEYNI